LDNLYPAAHEVGQFGLGFGVEGVEQFPVHAQLFGSFAHAHSLEFALFPHIQLAELASLAHAHGTPFGSFLQIQSAELGDV
jgi:hypothetical protein